MKEKKSKNSQANRPFFSISESASATVIGAVLLLAIIVSVFSVVRIGYIPEWKNDAEYSHMNDVWEDMADLKSKIDLMTIVLASDPNSTNTVTMNVPFRMGGGDVPLIGTIKSSGTLSIANRKECNMTVTSSSGGNQVYTTGPILYGTVNYASQNRYYVNQDFIYEGGALILSQGERSSMMLYPSIRFSRAPGDSYNVSVHVVEIDKKVYSPPDVVSSNTGCVLRLTGNEFRTIYDSDEHSSDNIDSFILTVNTDHPDAWYMYLNEARTGAKITDCTKLNQSGSNVSLAFSPGPSGKNLNRLCVSKTKVKVEPGIGI